MIASIYDLCFMIYDICFMNIYHSEKSYYLYHSKKSITYSQALRLNRTCLDNSSYDKRCNELEVWLREPGYCDKRVRQVLRACKHKRKDLLNDIKDKRNDY